MENFRLIGRGIFELHWFESFTHTHSQSYTHGDIFSAYNFDVLQHSGRVFIKILKPYALPIRGTNPAIQGCARNESSPLRQ